MVNVVPAYLGMCFNTLISILLFTQFLTQLAFWLSVSLER